MTIIFDYDGTLHKTEEIYGYAVRRALADIHEEGIISDEIYEPVKDVSNKRMAFYLGWKGTDVWHDFMPCLNDEEIDHVRLKVGYYMREGIKDGNSSLFDGVEELLAELKAKGHTLCILSNCNNLYLKAQNDHFKLDRWIDGFFPAEEYNYAPKYEIFDSIKERFEGPYVMVGDRANDIKVGVVHGFKSIGCAYGYCQEGELDEATVLVNRPIDILDEF